MSTKKGIESLSDRELLERLYTNQVVIFRQLNRIEKHLSKESSEYYSSFSSEEPFFESQFKELKDKHDSVKRQMDASEEQIF